MKYAFLIGTALLLAACGGDEPVPTATEEAPVSSAEEAVAEPEVVEETLEIVEEVLSEGDASQGLHRMVIDIAASLIRNLASYGVEFDAGFLNTLIAAYLRTAQDAIARYSDDALLNDLIFDRHEEELAVETFASALRTAGLGFVRDPMGAPQIPNWSRVTSALPELLDELRDAVEQDAADTP